MTSFGVHSGYDCPPILGWNDLASSLDLRLIPPYNRNMNDSLPFEREVATLSAPEWYDFTYSRRLKRTITPMSLMAVSLFAFGIFVILSCTYVFIAAAVVAEVQQGLFIAVGLLELVIIAVAVWALARDYEQRLKARRLTPYGRRLNEWVQTDFNPWLRENLSVYIDESEVEKLIVYRHYTCIGFRGTSELTIKYENGDIIVRRCFLTPVRSNSAYEVEDNLAGAA
jgi:hypothetical protein